MAPAPASAAARRPPAVSAGLILLPLLLLLLPRPAVGVRRAGAGDAGFLQFDSAGAGEKRKVTSKLMTRAEFMKAHHSGMHLHLAERRLERLMRQAERHQEDEARKRRLRDRVAAPPRASGGGRAGPGSGTPVGEASVGRRRDETLEPSAQGAGAGRGPAGAGLSLAEVARNASRVELGWALVGSHSKRKSKFFSSRWRRSKVVMDDDTGTLELVNIDGKATVKLELACVSFVDPGYSEKFSDFCFLVNAYGFYYKAEAQDRPYGNELVVCFTSKEPPEDYYFFPKPSEVEYMSKSESEELLETVASHGSMARLKGFGDDRPCVVRTDGSWAQDPEQASAARTFLQGLVPAFGAEICVQLEVSLLSLGLPGVTAVFGVSLRIGFDFATRCWSWSGRIVLALRWGFEFLGYFIGINIEVLGTMQIREVPWKQTGRPRRGVDDSKCRSYSPFASLWSYLRQLTKRTGSSDEMQAEIRKRLTELGRDAGFADYKDMLPQGGFRVFKPEEQTWSKSLRGDLWLSSEQRFHGEVVDLDTDDGKLRRCWFRCYGCNKFIVNLDQEGPCLDHAYLGAMRLNTKMFDFNTGSTAALRWGGHGGLPLPKRPAILKEARRECRKLAKMTHMSDACLHDVETLPRDYPVMARDYGPYHSDLFGAIRHDKTSGGMWPFRRMPDRIWPTDYRTAVAPGLMAAASALELAFFRFHRRLPHLASQILERLEVPDPEKPMTPFPPVDIEDGEESLLRKSDGRFLARIPAGLKDLMKEHVDIEDPTAGYVDANPVDELSTEELEQARVRDGSVANFARVAAKSEHKGDASFWAEFGASVANLFVRAVGDVQALWGIYFADSTVWDGNCQGLPGKFALWHEVKTSKIPQYRIKLGHNSKVKGKKISDDHNPWRIHSWVSAYGGGEQGKQRSKWAKKSYSNDGLTESWGTMYPHVWCELVSAAANHSNYLAQTPYEHMEVLGPFYDASDPELISASDPAAMLEEDVATFTDIAADRKKREVVQSDVILEVHGTCSIPRLSAGQWDYKARLDCERITIHSAFGVMFPRVLMLVEKVRDRLASDLAVLQACASGFDGQLPDVAAECRSMSESDKIESVLKKHAVSMVRQLQRFLVLLGAESSVPVFGSGPLATSEVGSSLMARDWHLNFAFEPLGAVMRGRLWLFLEVARAAMAQDIQERKAVWLKRKEAELNGEAEANIYAWAPVVFEYIVSVSLQFGWKQDFCAPFTSKVVRAWSWLWEGNSWDRQPKIRTKCKSAMFKNVDWIFTLERCRVDDMARNNADLAEGQAVQVETTVRTLISVSCLPYLYIQGFENRRGGKWVSMFKNGWADGPPFAGLPSVASMGFLTALANVPTMILLGRLLTSGVVGPKIYQTRDLGRVKESWVDSLILADVGAHLATGVFDTMKSAAEQGYLDPFQEGKAQRNKWIPVVYGQIQFVERWMRTQDDQGDLYFLYRERTLVDLMYLNFLAHAWENVPGGASLKATTQFEVSTVFNFRPWVKGLYDWYLQKAHRDRVAKCRSCLAEGRGFCDLKNVRPDWKARAHDVCRPVDSRAACEGGGYHASGVVRGWSDSGEPTQFVDGEGYLIHGDWFQPHVLVDENGTRRELDLRVFRPHPCERMQFVGAGGKALQSKTFYFARLAAGSWRLGLRGE